MFFSIVSLCVDTYTSKYLICIYFSSVLEIESRAFYSSAELYLQPVSLFSNLSCTDNPQFMVIWQFLLLEWGKKWYTFGRNCTLNLDLYLVAVCNVILFAILGISIELQLPVSHCDQKGKQKQAVLHSLCVARVFWILYFVFINYHFYKNAHLCVFMRYSKLCYKISFVLYEFAKL